LCFIDSPLYNTKIDLSAMITSVSFTMFSNLLRDLAIHILIKTWCDYISLHACVLNWFKSL